MLSIIEGADTDYFIFSTLTIDTIRYRLSNSSIDIGKPIFYIYYYRNFDFIFSDKIVQIITVLLEEGESKPFTILMKKNINKNVDNCPKT